MRIGYLPAFSALAVCAPAFAQEITVSPNVQVSREHSADAHFEVLVAADPKDPARMIAGSFRFPAGTMDGGTVVYATRDGGQHWAATLDLNRLANTSDPAPAYGADGWAYYTASLLGPAGTPREARKMLLFRSRDGGLKWDNPSELTYSDRQYITVDRTGGRFGGRIYVNGNNRVPYGISDYVVFRSADKGVTFQGPGTRDGFGKNSAGSMGNAVVASDGSLIGVFEEKNHLRLIKSVDGGASLQPATDIDTAYVEAGNRKGTNNNVVGLPFIAIDDGSAQSRDNLYVVWADRRTGHSRIFFTASTDKGLTWTKSRAMDDLSPSDSTDNFMPTVAVNKDGIVGVLWYDRRDHSDNLGWDVRFAASVDGGRTFLPSVRVSEQGTTFGESAKYTALRATSSRPAKRAGIALDLSLNNFTFLGGDTQGMAADAAGVFHPVWIDNRTGVPQVWTSSVSVGVRNPANGRDVSSLINLEVTGATFDRGAGTIEATVRLENTSQETVRGPFRVHVRETSSDLGDVRIGDNDWRFQEPSLAPGAHSATRKWSFSLSDIQSFRRGDRYRLGLLKLDALILSGQSPASQQSR